MNSSPDAIKLREIVAIRFGNNDTITNNRAIIVWVLENNLPHEWLDRWRMKFMADCDLGEKWRKLASGPTLFLMDNDGKPYPAPKAAQDDQP